MQALRYVVNQMDRYMLAQREYRTGCIVRIKHFIAKICCLVGGKLYGNYLISCYMMIKLVYVVNAVAQLFLLDVFLKIDYRLYGLHVVDRLIRGQDWGYEDHYCSFVGATHLVRTGLGLLGPVPARYSVRVRDTSSVSRTQLHRSVRSYHQPL